MLALYIILGILLFLFLLTLFNVRICFRYENEPFLTVRIAFIKLTILPPKPEKPKKQKKKPQKKKTPAKQAEKKPEKKSFNLFAYAKEKGISGIINIVKRVAKLAVGTLRDLFRHFIVTELRIDIKIAGENAADSAVNYGRVCSAFFPALKLITDIVTVEHYDVNVNPDFSDEPKSSAYALVNAKIRVLFILTTVIKRAFEGLMLFIKAKPKKRKKKGNEKQ